MSTDPVTFRSDVLQGTTEPDPGMFAHPLWVVVIILIILSIIILGTIIGNILVCTAVSIVRRLRTPSNWLIVSLAVADLSVAIFVMPLAAMLEVTHSWILGELACHAWTSLDVLLCTASILNLCMISIDRYFVITKPFQYALKRTPARMALMILSVWTLSALISIPPVFGWRAPYVEGECVISEDIGYQFYATIGAFYLPLTVMIIIYYRIYVVSSRIARAESRASKKAPSSGSDRDSTHSIFTRRKSSLGGESRGGGGNHQRSSVGNPQYGRSGLGGGTDNDAVKTEVGVGSSRQNSDDATSHSTVPLTSRRSFLNRRGSGGSEANRMPSANKSDRKATKTLGVIMGAFTLCWLPFFIFALIKAILVWYKVVMPEWTNVIASILQWLGYANSFLNPIIYARFNRDFRTPFKEILLCRCKGINLRLRSESYIDQYGPSSDRRSSVARPGSGASHGGGIEADGLIRNSSQPDVIVESQSGTNSKKEKSFKDEPSPTKVSFE